MTYQYRNINKYFITKEVLIVKVLISTRRVVGYYLNLNDRETINLKILKNVNRMKFIPLNEVFMT